MISQKNNAEFDLDALLRETLPKEEEDDNDVDLNDPELLRQLQELAAADGGERTTTIHKENPETFDIDEYAKLAQGEEEEVEVDLNEADFSDPHLLRELSELQQPRENITEKEHSIVKHEEADVERTTVLDEDRSMKEDVVREKEDKIEPAIGIEELKRQAAYYQKQALAAKRQGDKKKAVEYLRHAKALQSRIPPEQHDVEISNAERKQHALPERHVNAIQSRIQEPHTEENIPDTEQQQEESARSENADQLLKAIIELQKEYKQAAVHYKDLGNLALAREMVKTSKELLRLGVQLKNGHVRDLNAVQSKLPGKPDLTLGDGKIRQIQQVDASALPADQTLEHLESQLAYQVNVCHNLAIQTYTGKQQAATAKALSDTDRNVFAQLEQAFAADIISLRSRRDRNEHSTPKLHYEQVDYTYTNILDHIPANQMELKIVRGTGLQSLDVASNVEPFVSFNFNGWPPENTAHAALGKGETPVHKGSAPDFDFSIQIPIARGNRVFSRYVQRKKLTLEVFHNRYTYGFFRRPVSLGKVLIPLDPLLTKSSISGIFDLIDANRRKTGGRLEVQINLREPLNGQDIVKRSERWLVIDEFSPQTSKLLAAAKLTRQKSGGGVPAAATPSSSEQPRSTAPQPVQKSTVSKEQQPASSELEEAEEEFNSVDSIVSNMVLEYEINLATNALAGNSNKQLSAQAREDLIDRKQALEIKMNMLVIQVQTGMLDMETYLAEVKKRIEREKQLALLFKKHQRLDLAKAALARKKIMQDEVDEAEAAMAQGA